MNTQKGHPQGLYLLFVTEMAERFSYYGMRALFTLYLVAAFFNEGMASQLYGSYTGLVYLTPLLGGYIADRYWGNRRSIIAGGLMMALGQFFMFLSACFVKQSIFEGPTLGGAIDSTVDNSLSLTLMFCGLGALILGNGFFKPNISTMVGDLYAKEDKRRDAAFTIFYMGINVGATIAPFVCGTVGEGSWNNLEPFKWGFLCACIAMLLSVIVFVALKNRYLVTPEGLGIGLPPKQSQLLLLKEMDEREEEADYEGVEIENPENAMPLTAKNSPLRLWGCVIGAIVLMVVFSMSAENFNDIISAAIYAISLTLPVFIITDRGLTKLEKMHIGVIYIIALFVIFFWSAFEQAGSSLTLFADRQVDRMVGDFEVKTTWFQSVNAVCVVIFAPVMAALWQFLGRRHLEPDSPVKQAIGLVMLALGYLIISLATRDMAPGVKVSMFWLLGLYFLHTIGELSLSPIGLSLVTKLSPPQLASLLMGVWFMSNATSNILAGKLATLLPVSGQPAKSFLGFEIATLDQFFMLFAVMSGVAAVVLFAICPLLKKMMKGVE